MSRTQIIIASIVEDVVGDPDHLVQILAIHLLIDEDQPNIQKQSVDIAHIPEAEGEIEIIVKKVTKALEIVIQKEEKDTGIILDHILQIIPREKLDQLQEKNLGVVQVVHNLM